MYGSTDLKATKLEVTTEKPRKRFELIPKMARKDVKAKNFYYTIEMEVSTEDIDYTGNYGAAFPTVTIKTTMEDGTVLDEILTIPVWRNAYFPPYE